jgi:hypothetical protein
MTLRHLFRVLDGVLQVADDPITLSQIALELQDLVPQTLRNLVHVLQGGVRDREPRRLWAPAICPGSLPAH